MDVLLRVPVQPTESEAKVAAAVRALFPEARLARTPLGWEGWARDAAHLGELIRRQRIPDTARGVLLRAQRGGSAAFALGKQAAAAGKLSFAAREGPLGDIAVELRAASAADLARVIDELAPDTRGWSLEERGLTEKALRAQEREEGALDELEREGEGEGDGGGGGA